MNKKQKFYVVWAGENPGIYESWEACKKEVFHYDGARYKSFESLTDAQQAFNDGYELYYKKNPAQNKMAPQNAANAGEPILESLSVDAAWNTVTKVMEYRGVHTRTKEVWFHKGPFPGASNNIGEFLALVHGLALLKQRNLQIPIYSDSVTAMAWVRAKKHKSIILPTEENAAIFDLLNRAEYWLRTNTYCTPIYKWNTPVWGEIPADFGRK
ncbi:MAG: ribonuclease H family protein [Bacteroidales bacterium]|nr:ribonuclease H family protein [Bacteroidales bacterium]